MKKATLLLVVAFVIAGCTGAPYEAETLLTATPSVVQGAYLQQVKVLYGRIFLIYAHAEVITSALTELETGGLTVDQTLDLLLGTMQDIQATAAEFASTMVPPELADAWELALQANEETRLATGDFLEGGVEAAITIEIVSTAKQKVLSALEAAENVLRDLAGLDADELKQTRSVWLEQILNEMENLYK